MRNRALLTASLIAALLCVGFIYRQTRPQWEYKFVQMKLDFKKTDVALSDWGAQGWEAYAVTEENGIVNFYLKRARQ